MGPGHLEGQRLVEQPAVAEPGEAVVVDASDHRRTPALSIAGPV